MPPGTPSGHIPTALGSPPQGRPPAGPHSGRPARCLRHCAAMAAQRVTDRLLSQVEAARLAGCSRDTIVRARRAGRFPNARFEKDRWTIPSGDLVAAGLYRAADHDTAPVEPTDDAKQPGDAPAVELARAEARIAGLEALVASQEDELRFLRLTVETLTSRGAA